MTATDLSSEQVRRALLDQNYLPRASRHGDDLPPSLSTLGVNAVSKQVVDAHTDGRHRHPKSARSTPGYSYSEGRVAHYRWTPRRVEIPHPVAYCNLVETIALHWDTDIAPRMDSAVSQFTVRQHRDGRIASMKQSRPHMRPGVGSRFRVRTDIASFYDSIYTHSLPWALLGKATAKSNRTSDVPANQLDSALRFARRGETTGVSIGPGTSLIVAELLLGEIDSRLSSFTFERFLDDYIAYARTETEAEAFVRTLDSSLREYGLRLSGPKTIIEPLPLPDEPAWIRELRRHRGRPGELLDRAVELSRADPQASAIQWVLMRLRREIYEYSPRESTLVVRRLAELAYSHPHTTPVLVDVAKANPGALSSEEIDVLIQKHAGDAQSGAVAWLLHLSWIRDQAISDSSWDAVLEMGDSVANAYLLHSQSNPSRRELLVASLTDPATDDYSRDESWPARYVAFCQGVDEAKDPGFDELRQGGVNLLRDPREPSPISDGTDAVDGEPEMSDDTGVVEGESEDPFDSWTDFGMSG